MIVRGELGDIMKTNVLHTCYLVLFILASPATVSANKPTPFGIIGVRAGDEFSLQCGRKLEALTKGHVSEFEKNPVCCFWIEHWAPTNATGLYCLIRQEHGAILLVSDDSGFDAAIAYIRSRKRGNEFDIPNGVITNLPVMKANGGD